MTVIADPTISQPQLQFRRAVYVYDRSAVDVAWDIDGDTLFQVYPADAQPGYLQVRTRTMIPPEVMVALRKDFPALRRLAEIAEADQPWAPIEHPEVRSLRRRVRVLAGVVAAESVLLLWVGAELLSRTA